MIRQPEGLCDDCREYAERDDAAEALLATHLGPDYRRPSNALVGVVGPLTDPDSMVHLTSCRHWWMPSSHTGEGGIPNERHILPLYLAELVAEDYGYRGCLICKPFGPLAAIA